ncbi:hypothetical protein BN871_CR_00230 [Paenibacillus sp. P22]|nr:hypothetical protein BN871_CR_00230 [Paenibacillus sp. P22]
MQDVRLQSRFSTCAVVNAVGWGACPLDVQANARNCEYRRNRLAERPPAAPGSKTGSASSPTLFHSSFRISFYGRIKARHRRRKPGRLPRQRMHPFRSRPPPCFGTRRFACPLLVLFFRSDVEVDDCGQLDLLPARFRTRASMRSPAVDECGAGWSGLDAAVGRPVIKLHASRLHRAGCPQPSGRVDGIDVVPVLAFQRRAALLAEDDDHPACIPFRNDVAMSGSGLEQEQIQEQ